MFRTCSSRYRRRKEKDCQRIHRCHYDRRVCAVTHITWTPRVVRILSKLPEKSFEKGFKKVSWVSRTVLCCQAMPEFILNLLELLDTFWCFRCITTREFTERSCLTTRFVNVERSLVKSNFNNFSLPSPDVRSLSVADHIILHTFTACPGVLLSLRLCNSYYPATVVLTTDLW